MYKLVRSLLFLFDAEFIHEISTKLIKFYNYIPFVSKLLRKKYLISDKLLLTFNFVNIIYIMRKVDIHLLRLLLYPYLASKLIEPQMVTTNGTR